MQTETSQKLYKRAKEIIPGGTQLLSKRPEMFAPDLWPAYYKKAKGCEIWDIDNNHYYDMSTNGIGSCLLGYADPDINAAVIKRVKHGSMSTLNPPEEVELAERLIALHPWAKQVRFARTGGEIGAVAVRIARATTGRSKIAVCGYHGWQDWYLAANLSGNDALNGHLLPGLDPAGVPRELQGTTLTFKYNDLEQLKNIIHTHGNDLAAVIMEPTRYTEPENNFLQNVITAARQCGALVIFDEITIGWRLCFGGAHLVYQAAPDMAIFAKALGNGHPIAAVLGTKEAMRGAEKSFISSTYWTESVGPAAALAVLKKMERINIPAHIKQIGEKVITLWKDAAKKYAVPVTVCENRPCITHFSFSGKDSNLLKTIYTVEMLRLGFIANTSIYPTLAHNDKNIALYGKAIDAVFAKIADLVRTGSAASFLKTPEAHTGFARLT